MQEARSKLEAAEKVNAELHFQIKDQNARLLSASHLSNQVAEHKKQLGEMRAKELAASQLAESKEIRILELCSQISELQQSLRDAPPMSSHQAPDLVEMRIKVADPHF